VHTGVIIVLTAQICFNEPFLVGEMLYFVTNQLFTLSIIVIVNGKSHIDYVVFTFVAQPLLGNNLLGNYPSSLFRNLSDNMQKK